MSSRQKKSKIISLFHVVDIESLAPLKLSVELEYTTYKGQVKKEMLTTPLLIKSTNTWTKISIYDEDYHKVNLVLDKQNLNYKPKFLFVKKKFLYEVDIKKVKEISNCSENSIRRFDLNDAFQSRYLLAILSIAQDESSTGSSFPSVLSERPLVEARKSTAANSNQILLYYTNAIYQILKKGKSSLLPLCLYYLTNKYFGNHVYDSQIRDSKSLFVTNGKLIMAFEGFLNHITEK
jgi:hypothetical protein